MAISKRIKIFTITALTGVLMTTTMSFASDIINPNTLPNIKAYTLYDRENNVLISDYNSETPMGLASISKLMTAKIIYDNLTTGVISLEDQVYISSNAQSQDGDGLRVRAGDYYKLDDLLHGMLICSSNDAAVAIAEHIAGSEEAFVAMMNQEAKNLGLESAHFENPSGLTEYDSNHDPYPNQNIMSIADIDKLADILMTNYPQITEITKLDEWVFEPKNITKHSTNVFLDDYSEVDGLKTGFTNYAGYCQIISASLCDLPIDNSVFETIFNKAPVSTYTNNRNIFASVLGSTSKTYRTRTLASILDYSKSSLAIYPVADKLVPLYTDDSGVFSIIPAENISLLLPNNSQIDYQVFINPLWQYTNMLVNGMNVGKITYYSDDMTPVTTELILDTHQSNTDLEEHVEALQIADEELRYSRYSGQ